VHRAAYCQGPHGFHRQGRLSQGGTPRLTPGRELEDWLAAENEVDQRLAGEGRVF
jgi:hypothetical protein